MRRAAFFLALLLLAGCFQSPSVPPSPLPSSTGTRVEEVYTGLDTVWGIAFSNDGRVFFTERPGRIRVGEEGRLSTWATIDVAESGESGLFGIALHPRFPDDPRVYVMATQQKAGGTVNRVLMLRESDGRGAQPVVLVDDIPAASIHDGGRLAFGPDGRLYVSTGDAAQPARAQDPASLLGKILRLNDDGSVPADNPVPGSLVYTRGHRNAQGLCWQPGTGRLFSTEHGPDSDDEVNLITAGANYGWPLHRGTDEAPGFVAAMMEWTPTIAPAGCTFYDGAKGSRADWAGDLFLVTLKERDLRRLRLTDGSTPSITGQEILFDGRFGRLRDVVQGPDGHLWLATSNHDGRGSPAAGDDRVLRVVA